MKRLIPYLLLAVGLAIALASQPAAAPASAFAAPAMCETLTTAKLANTTITSAQLMSTGSFTAPGGGRGARPIENLPPFCAVHGIIKPSPTSSIHFEAWLPEGNWNGRLQVVGNGGLAGTIGYAAMASALREGSATASTDGSSAGSPAASATSGAALRVDGGVLRNIA